MNRTRSRLGALIAAIAIIVGISTTSQVAGAVDWWAYSDRRWPSSTVAYALGNLSYFNGGSQAVTVSTIAIETWDFLGTPSLGNSSWDLQYAGADFTQNWPGACVNANYWVYQQDLNAAGYGGILGYTQVCQNGGSAPTYQAWSANTRMSTYSSIPWAVQTTTPIANWRYDYWSTLTHDAGHAWGHINHFAWGGSDCPGTTANSTLCDGINQGGTHQRSPESHERSHLKQLYP